MVNVTKVHYEPAQAVTGKTNADVKAGTFVSIAGNINGRNPLIATSKAGDRPFGVVAHDCKATEHVTVYRGGFILELVATGSVAAGDPVAVGANGSAVKAAEAAVVVGVAASAAANGTVIVSLA